MKNRATQKILKKEKIYNFETDIRLLSRKEIAKHLATHKGRIPMSRLMKNIIWNAHQQIQKKEAEVISGNIRTFWYLWVKPVLNHIQDDDKSKTNHYDTMLKQFTHLILDLKLLQYKDFDFTDENWQNRWIGTLRPEVLVFSEKTGWVRFLREVHKKLGVSTLALGGFPSALTSEYTATHVAESLKEKKKKIKLIGIVDYDFSGDLIATAFQKQLTETGLNISSLETVIHPKAYDRREIEIFKFKLPKNQKTKLKRWMEKTSGIDGEPYGLESESLKKEKVWKAIENIVLNKTN